MPRSALGAIYSLNHSCRRLTPIASIMSSMLMTARHIAPGIAYGVGRRQACGAPTHQRDREVEQAGRLSTLADKGVYALLSCRERA